MSDTKYIKNNSGKVVGTIESTPYSSTSSGTSSEEWDERLWGYIVGTALLSVVLSIIGVAFGVFPFKLYKPSFWDLFSSYFVWIAFIFLWLDLGFNDKYPYPLEKLLFTYPGYALGLAVGSGIVAGLTAGSEIGWITVKLVFVVVIIPLTIKWSIEWLGSQGGRASVWRAIIDVIKVILSVAVAIALFALGVYALRLLWLYAHS